MGRRIVCGDIHGAHLALLQCLERSNFDFENDTLILIGDVVDGWPYVYEVVEILLKCKNIIFIKGNHDDWFLDFLKDGYSRHPRMWGQGGKGTLESYVRYSGHSIEVVRTWDAYNRCDIITCNTDMKNTDVPQTHHDFFKRMVLHHKDFRSNFFVHGGIDRNHYIDYLTFANPQDFYWNRKLWDEALSHKQNDRKFRMAEDFKRVFIGHSATLKWDTDKPMLAANLIWNVDTGAGWKGKLTFMDVDTYEFWQSDCVKELYPNEDGR